MKNLSNEQLDLLEMLADTSRLRHIPEASEILVSLEELGLIGSDFTLTAAGKMALSGRSPDQLKRRMH